jgi:hypothetical protein
VQRVEDVDDRRDADALLREHGGDVGQLVVVQLAANDVDDVPVADLVPHRAPP